MKKIAASFFLFGMIFMGFTAKSQKGMGNMISTPSGLKYKITNATNGKQPKPGDKVFVHYTGRLTNDTIFDTSYKRGQPFSFILGKGQVIKGWDDGIGLMRVGEKAVLSIPPELGYGQRDMGVIPSNSTLIFEVELIDIKEKITPKPFEVKGLDTTKTATGLKVIILDPGLGTQVKAGMNVKVHYTGYLMDGKIFDSSVERGDPLPFKLGQGMVIKGWEEGISLLKVGGKARLIIPPDLAYGEKGFPPIIPPNSVLIFDVELIEAKDPALQVK